MDEEDEALSLCDLPVNSTKQDDSLSNYESPTPREEFDFCSVKYYSTIQPTAQMCSADELFFQGRILPVRLSVASENSSGNLRRGYRRSESESDSVSFSGVRIAGNSRPRVPNVFHSHPSPKPNIQANPGDSRRSQKPSGSTWHFFRLGVVGAPGMELEDLKCRSRRTDWNSGSRSSSGRSFVLNDSEKDQSMRRKARTWMEGKSGILSGVGCKCSVETVAPAMAVRSGGGRSIRVHWIGEKEKMKKLQKEKEQQEKLALSRLRTFEWLEELSHASFPCDV